MVNAFLKFFTIYMSVPVWLVARLRNILFGRLGGIRLILFAALVTSTPAWSADPGSTAKRSATATIGGRFGSDYGEAYLSVFAPLNSKEGSLIFINPRFALKDEGAAEGNLGLGFRQMIADDKAIFGANIYVDRSRSEHDIDHDQWGLGLELLTESFDFRANYYDPGNSTTINGNFDINTLNSVTEVTRSAQIVEETSSALVNSRTVNQIVDRYLANNLINDSIFTTTDTIRTTKETTTTTTTLFTTTNTFTDLFFEKREGGLEGFDLELGYKLPLKNTLPEVRLFGGYYDFEGPFDSEIKGAKGRLEIRAGEYFTFDAEYFDDKELHGSDYFFGARVNIPFSVSKLFSGKNPFLIGKSDMKSFRARKLSERLDEEVIRDVEIHVAESQFVENLAKRAEKVEVSVVEEVDVGVTSEFTDRNEVSVAVRSTTYTVGGDDLTFTHVDNTDTGTDTGTFENPNQSLTAANATQAADANDVVLLHSDSAFDNESVNVTDNQWLIGQGGGVETTITTDQGDVVLPEANPDGTAAPVISNGNVNINSSNVVVTNVVLDGGSIETAAGGAHDNLTITNVKVSNSSGVGVNLGSGGGTLDGTITLSDIEVDNSTGNGIVLENLLGTANVVGTNLTSNANAGSGLAITNAAAGANLAFNNSQVDGNAANGIDILNSASTFSFTDTNTSNSTGAGINVENTSGQVNFAGTTSISGAGAAGIQANNNTGAVNFTGTTDVTAPGAVGIQANNNAGAVSFAGTTTVSDSGADGIQLSDNSGNVSFMGTTTITDPGANGITLSNNTGSVNFDTTNIDLGATAGTSGIDYQNTNAATNFGAVAVTDVGAGDNQVGIDFNGATLTDQASYESVAISGPETSQNSVAVDLTGIQGNQLVNLGSGADPATGPSSSITNTHRGVVIDPTASVQFTFGDGENPADAGSTINVNNSNDFSYTVDAGNGTLASASFNFDDVVVGVADEANFPVTPNAPIFVSTTGGMILAGVNGLSQDVNTIDTAAAEALAPAGQIFVFVGDASGIVDVQSGFVDGFTLSAGQTIQGFNNGNGIGFGTLQPANISGNLGASGGMVTANSATVVNSNRGASSIVNAAGGNNTIANNIFDLTLDPAWTGTPPLAPVNAINIAGVTSDVTVMGIDLTNIGITPVVHVGVNLDDNSGNVTLVDIGLTGTNAGTALQIDNTTASTGQVTADSTSSLGGTTGTVISIGTGMRDINLGATAITSSLNTETAIAIDDQTGGNITIGDVTLNGGTGPSAIEVTNQTGGTLTFGTVDVGGMTGFNNATGTAVNIQGTGGAVNFTELNINATDGDALSAGAIALSIANSTNDVIAGSGSALTLVGTDLSSGLTFNQLSSSGGNIGALLQNLTGDLVVNGGVISNANNGIVLDGGTVDVTYVGDIAHNTAGGPALVVSSQHTGMLTYTGSIQDTAGSGLLFDNADGVYDFNGPVNLNGGSAHIDIRNDSAGTFTFADTTITNPSGVALDIQNSTANITYSGGGINQGNNATAVNVVNHSVGTINIGIDVNATNGDGLQFDNADGTYNFNTMTGNVILNGGDAGIDILNDSAGTFTFGDTTITNPTGVAVNMDSSPGMAIFRDLDINQSVGSGVQATNSGSLSIGVGGVAGSTIDNTTGDGINIVNTDFTGEFLSIGADGNIGDDGIDISNTDASNRTSTVENSNIFNIAGTSIANRGITIDSSGTGTLNANIRTTQITSDNQAIFASSGGTAGSLVLDLADNGPLQTNNANVHTLEITGGGLNSTIVTTLGPNTTQIIGNGLSGGVLFDRVTFDASGAALASTQVTGGTIQVGQGILPFQRIQGDGISFLATSGDVSFTELDVFNNLGTGLEVDTKSAPGPTNFNLVTGASSTIDTTNGSAMFLDPLTGDLNFDAVTSTNATALGATGLAASGNGTGVFVDELTASGGAGTNALTIGVLNVSGPAADGVSLVNTVGDVTIGNAAGGGGSINVAGGNAVNVTGGSVVASFAGMNIGATGGTTVNINGGTTGDISFLTSDVEQSGAGQVINVDGATAGNILFDAAGSVSAVTAANTGININNTDANVTVANAELSNTAGDAVTITGGTGQMNFDNLDVTNAGDDGIQSVDLAGTLLVQNGSSFTNTTGDGINVDNTVPTATVVQVLGTVGTNEFDTIGDDAISVTNSSGDVTISDVHGTAVTGDMIQLTNHTGASTVTNGLTLVDLTMGGTAIANFINQTGTINVNDALMSNLIINGGNANFNFNAGTQLVNSNNTATVDVIGHMGGTVDYLGTINATNGSGLQFTNADGTYNFGGMVTLNGGDAGIDILAGSAGTFTFGGATTINNTAGGMGVNFDGTGGGTLQFNGGLDINTTNGTAFNATGGGTVGVANAGTESVVTNGTAGAINIDGVTVAAGGITFDQVTTANTATATAVDINNASGGPINLASVNLNGALGTTGLDITGDMRSSAVTVSGGNINNGLNIANNGSGNVTVDAAITNGTGEYAVRISDRSGGTPGLIDINGNVTSNVFGAVSLQNNSAGTVQFDGSVTGNTGNPAGALNLDNNTATTSFNGLVDLDQTTAGLGISMNNSNADFNNQVNIDGTGNSFGVQIFNNSTANFNNGLAITAVDGTAFDVNTGSTILVADSAGIESIATTGLGRAINIDAATIAAGGVNFESVTSSAATSTNAVRIVDAAGADVTLASVNLDGTNTTAGIEVAGNARTSNLVVTGGTINNGVTISDSGSGTVTIGAAITDNMGFAVQVANRNAGAGDVNVNGTVTNNTGAVSIMSNSAGIVNFNGVVTGTGANTAGAIGIDNNMGGTTNFAALVDIDVTGAGTGVQIGSMNTTSTAIHFNAGLDVNSVDGTAFEALSGTVGVADAATEQLVTTGDGAALIIGDIGNSDTVAIAGGGLNFDQITTSATFPGTAVLIDDATGGTVTLNNVDLTVGSVEAVNINGANRSSDVVISNGTIRGATSIISSGSGDVTIGADIIGPSFAAIGAAVQVINRGGAGVGTVNINGTVTGNDTGAVRILGNNAGTVNFNSTVTSGHSSGNAIEFDGNSNTSLVNFAGQVDLNMTGTGVGVNVVAGDTGTINFNAGLDIATVDGTGFNALGGIVNVANGAGTNAITSDSGSGIVLDSVTSTTGINFTSVDLGSAANPLVANVGIDINDFSGTLNVAGGTIFYGDTNGGATNPPAAAIEISETAAGTGTGNITIDTNLTAALVGGGAGHSVDIDGLRGGTVNFGGTFTDTAIGNQGGIRIRNMVTAPTAINFTGMVQANTGGGESIDLENNAGSTITFSGGLDLSTTSDEALRIADGGAVTVSGASNNIATGAGTGILIDGNTDAVNFSGPLSITASTGTAVDIAGTLGAAVTFSDLDIALTGANSTGFDVSAATLNANFSAGDFDVTSTSSTGTTAVDLAGTTGTGTIQLGDTDTNGGPNVSIGAAGMELASGVNVDAATNVNFVLGDGDGTVGAGSDGIASTMTVTNAVTGVLPMNGTYNFADIDFTTSNVNNLLGATVYFVDQATNGSGATQTTAGTIVGAEASGADAIILLDTVIGAGGNVINMSTGIHSGSGGGANTLDLADGQLLLGLTQGQVIDLSTFGLGGAPANFITSLGGSAMITGIASLDTTGPILTTNTGDTVIGTGTIYVDGVTVSNSGAGNALSNTAPGSGEIAISNSTFTGGSAGAGILLDGANTATITAFANNVVTSASSNGIDISNVTFDSDTGTAGIQQVAAGNVSVGTIGSRVDGDGIRLNNVLGNIAFGQMDVFNTNGTGLFVRDAAGKVGTFSISNTGGTIDTTNGTAMDIDPVMADFTFGTVSSTNAIGQGSSAATAGAINFDTVSAQGGLNGNALNVGTVNITGSNGNGINIADSFGVFTFGATTINNSASTGGGVDLNNTAEINFNGLLDIDTTSGTGFTANGTGDLNLNGGFTIDTTTGLGLSLLNTGAAQISIGGSSSTINTVSNEAINISAADVSGTIASASISALNGSRGIDINTHRGNLTITGGSIVNTGNQTAIEITGSIGSTLNIGTDVNSAGATGLAVDVRTSTSGSNITLSGNLSDDGALGGGINVNGNTNSMITLSGNSQVVNTGSNNGVTMDNNSGSTIGFSNGGLDIDTTSGAGFHAINGGTFNVTGSGNTINTTSGTALRLQGGTITGDVNFDTVSASALNGNFGIVLGLYNGDLSVTGGSLVNTGAVAAIEVTAGNGTVSIGSDINSSNATGRAIDVSSRFGGSVTFSGNLTDNNAAGGSIFVFDNTAGSVTFSGGVKQVNTTATNAVDLSNNTGSTVNFSGGGLDIDTTSGIGFDVTGGGTNTVQGAGNSVASTTGTAINIQNTLLGAAGVTFQSVNKSGASAVGIDIDGGGSGGFFTITGTGTTNGSGGTIANTTQNGILIENTDNITLNNVTLTTAADNGGTCNGTTFSGCNASLEFNSVNDVDIANLNLNGSDQHGIFANNVTDFDISNSIVQNAGNAANEHGIFLNNVFGTAAAGTGNSIANTIVSNSGNQNVFWRNESASAGTPDLLQITGSTFSDLILANPAQAIGLLVNSRNSADMRIEVSGSTFTNVLNGIRLNGDGGDIEANIDNNNIGHNGAIGIPTGNLSGGISSVLTQNSNLDFVFNNNRISMNAMGAVEPAGIRVVAFDTATFDGDITNNTIQNQTNSPTIFGISAKLDQGSGGGLSTVTISGNTITIDGTMFGGRGIELQSGGTGGRRLDAILTNNNITFNNPGNTTESAVFASAGQQIGGESSILCVDYNNNNADFVGGTLREYVLIQHTGNTFIIDGLTGSGTSTANIESYVNGQNASGTTIVAPVGALGTAIVNYSSGTCNL